MNVDKNVYDNFSETDLRAILIESLTDIVTSIAKQIKTKPNEYEIVTSPNIKYSYPPVMTLMFNEILDNYNKILKKYFIGATSINICMFKEYIS